MSSFTSVTLGNIHPPINILKEFLATFNRRQKCKAAILSWLDGKHYYGQEWVRITFDNLADILGYCRETISRHIRKLVFDGLIEEQPSHRFPKDTACEYRLNQGKITEIIEFNQCEKIGINVPNISDVCANNPSTYETNLNLFENNNTAVGKKQDGEVDWEALAKETETWERLEKFCAGKPGRANFSQSQTSDYVGQSEQVDSTETINSGEDEFPQPQVKVIMTLEKPTKQEVKEVCTELKRLRINPDPCLGVIKKYWENVQGAIARVKEAIHEGWCNNPTGLFINSCKSGEKAKNTVTSDVSAWFEWARRERIVLAMSTGVVYTPEGEAVEIEEMMQQYPLKE
ncbi:MAG: helix-turn-helix domain-containing protein [Nostocaceae cyanobacterium]|nr:helix-turn-helix domain-containing protein [Nostocaceae cyanobacterium]